MSYRFKTPKQAMFELIDQAVKIIPHHDAAGHFYRNGKWPMHMAPGYFVSRQTSNIRELLKKLTSDDLLNVRINNII